MATLTVVLVGVEHPGNLGAIARVMKNFGVEKLLLIDPQCDPGAQEARNRAKWANDLLEQAKVDTLDSLDQYDLVVGTTAELGNDFNLPRTPLTPNQLSEKLSTVAASRIALVFGRESDGLTNEELGKCDFSVTIPTNTAYPTLNLSHAVAVLLYALRSGEFQPVLDKKFPLVKAAEKEQLRKMIEETLDGYDFPTAEKRDTQELLWKRLIAKSMLTQREAMALMGFFKRAKKER